MHSLVGSPRVYREAGLRTTGERNRHFNGPLLRGWVRLREAVRLCGGDRGPDLRPAAAPAKVLDWPFPRLSPCLFPPSNVTQRNICKRPCLSEELGVRISKQQPIPEKRLFLGRPRAGWGGSCTGGWRRARCVSRGWAPPRRPARPWPAAASTGPCPCRSPGGSTPGTGR